MHRVSTAIQFYMNNLNLSKSNSLGGVLIYWVCWRCDYADWKTWTNFSFRQRRNELEQCQKKNKFSWFQSFYAQWISFMSLISEHCFQISFHSSCGFSINTFLISSTFLRFLLPSLLLLIISLLRFMNWIFGNIASFMNLLDKITI